MTEAEGTSQETAGASAAAQESFQRALDRGRQLNEQILQSARKAGEQMLDRYVSWLEDIAEQQQKLADAPRVSPMDWMAAMLNAQADFTRKLAESVREFPGRSSS
jgi:hypothetical protein